MRIAAYYPKHNRTWMILQVPKPKVDQQQNTCKDLHFGWPSQTPDLNPTQKLWHDMKQAVHTTYARNTDKESK